MRRSGHPPPFCENKKIFEMMKISIAKLLFRLGLHYFSSVDILICPPPAPHPIPLHIFERFNEKG